MTAVNAVTATAAGQCPAWCIRPHPDGYPTGYCESAPLATWEKTPGDVRTVTTIRFVPALADRVRSADMVAVKGAAKPILFTPDEPRTLARLIGGVPGLESVNGAPESRAGMKLGDML